ncbi:MAG: hypothetical protein A3D31_08950 [Candidatus Fluviicola riflensis]|nr:MAG: hypothetical protein CHH17_13360 [Candidatus Fluviicola riflensis]OGS77138.1 MAG: hypothetical protein A3D31_08950 [Candidatus Fluviicola riflensis]OGS82073.1 MAG: hypothetical protein A2724_17895 [Fluviicola sp. RIFCSPHIGHO2_01_FULL_43_53]OGS87767.1 MAG: hypothetical protein A3E30_15330 [Fluviicola sp. RIFCSPHIGHO2_12_FULL_43_24]
MDHISAAKSLELFLYALSHLDESHLDGSDEDLIYFVLDELDGDAHTFFHNYTVDLLINANLIPVTVRERTLTLRDFVKCLIDTKNTLDEIRNDSEWNNARQIAAGILKDIRAHQTTNENS